MTLTQQLIEQLETGPCPSSDDIKALAYALHGAMVKADAPELLWMSTTFEDMGDSMYQAIKCSDRDEEMRTV